ncbi:MAG: DNA-directed RNA polymerase subunit beta [Firmicutes bacterium]|nr:DNA-directed RNA polymerase subunit beta [Bacillota bacterium]
MPITSKLKSNGRLSFQKIPHVLEIPNLIELQRSSYEWFLKEGMQETFNDISPIVDFTGNLVLEFLEHSFGEPQYSTEECRDRDMTYALPLKVRVRLITKEAGEVKEIKEQEIFMGDFPSMTPKGTFLINGAERVIVSQLVRSPGVYFQATTDPSGKKYFVATVIPDRGAWMEFESDANDAIGVRIDKTRKVPATALIRALGYATDKELLKLFNNDPVIVNTMAKDGMKNQDEALVEIYRKLRPGDPPNVESAKNLIHNLFFDSKRYNLAKVGRYKLAKKLGLKIPCKKCGSLFKAGVTVCNNCKTPLVYETTLNRDDIVAIVKCMTALVRGEGDADDIDHLGNRRIRAVGELLQNQFRVGLLRLERVVRERMTVQDIETVTPQALINIRPVVAAIKEFFGSSQLSQFMDQTNSLAELTHKRRLSALGPGGLSRERAGFEVRDVHYSHYGRICPIETPEGPNIGLIGSLATFARVNEFGFIMTPYRKVKKGVVFDELVYLSADEEDDHVIAQANTPIDEHNRIVDQKVVVRARHETQIVPVDQVDFMDVSPKQIVSVATALIPFLEHDDANRALMGANMQRQAVPLIQPDSPVVATGMEYRAAKDSGALVIAEEGGIVLSVTADEIVIQDAKGKKRVYTLSKFKRSNAGTCINQRPIVSKGDKVQANQVIADGSSSVRGELALGRNVLVAFMPWEGYNYEDAILISEALVKDDVYTSIHIEEYECEARDTKLGAEEITRDIPNVGEEALKDLDERGIIRIGAEVRPEDILVGKVTPKGETELTAEERLLRAIFGEKARDVRDTSLKVPHGEKGKVIDVKVFSREKGDELSPGVNQLVRVYVAQKRKVLQGDKLAGRHGNKGVIAKVLPVEDMPYLPDGTPIEIVLNPLGVPSRMNIGQVLETHIGGAAQMLGLRVECPVFDGATEAEIRSMMRRAKIGEIFKNHGIDVDNAEIIYIIREETLTRRLKNFMKKKDMVLTDSEVESLINKGKKKLDEYIAGFLEKSKVAFSQKELSEVLQEKTMEIRLREVLKKKDIQKTEAEIQDLAGYIELMKTVEVDGKSILFDGRSGEAFDRRITIGQIYMMKLAHLVDDKIHARSTGPYSLITQQPLGGKAQFGGQRFGEMEVWALEAYGAAYTLQELLTVKSDDVVGRVKTYEAIVKGENVLEPGVPESFKVLMKELQSLCLDVKILSADEKEIELKGIDEDKDIKATARELGLDIGEEAVTI